MHFKNHSDLIGKHAFLSASNYHWINYDPEKMVERYAKHMDAVRGTRLHALAHDLVSLGVKLPATHQTLNMYVNDCIGYRMRTEQILFYSYNAFGTADAIWFGREPDSDLPTLRIFDLKNGVTPTKVTQLEVYAALFCLEYKVAPAQIDYDLRIYQHDLIYSAETNEDFITDPEEIMFIMEKIKEFDAMINSMSEEV